MWWWAPNNAYFCSFSWQLSGRVANPQDHSDPVYHAIKPTWCTKLCRLVIKSFQEDQLNFRRFPVFPEGILNSSRFPVFSGAVDTLYSFLLFNGNRRFLVTPTCSKTHRVSVNRFTPSCPSNIPARNPSLNHIQYVVSNYPFSLFSAALTIQPCIIISLEPAVPGRICTPAWILHCCTYTSDRTERVKG